MKTLKEYLGISTIRVGGLDSIHPIASLGDTPPKGKGSRDSRATGLVANYTSQGVGTIKPMLTANKEYDLKDKALYMKLVRQAMSVMPGSEKQKQIKKEIERVQKRLGIKENEDKEMEDFLNDLANNTPNADQFEDTKRIPRKKGQKAGSDKHSDLYTDENPKGTIQGLGFTDAETARTSVNKIKNSGKTHAHKIQAAIAMSQRAKVASERAKDPKKKKDLGAAHRVYQSFIDTNKKKD